MTSHILWKIKNVWNHQPVMIVEFDDDLLNLLMDYVTNDY